jgi:hypothetical protein
MDCRSTLSILASVGLLACARSSPLPPSSATSEASPVGAAEPSHPAAFAPPTELTARLADASTIDLTWKHNATEAGGDWVEFSTPHADFVKLAPVWPDTTTFRHSDVAADTTFLYRIVPFFGRVSNTTAVVTPAATVRAEHHAEGPLAETGPSAADTLPKQSMRTQATMAAAAPIDLTSVLSTPASVELRWRDRARDEDGYLVEVSTDAQHFGICALLPKDTTSFRKIALLSRTTYYFRVRAFVYGAPSKICAVSTPAEHALVAPSGRAESAAGGAVRARTAPRRSRSAAPAWSPPAPPRRLRCPASIAH